MDVSVTAWPAKRLVQGVRILSVRCYYCSTLLTDFLFVFQLICAYFLLILTHLSALCSIRLAHIGSFKAFGRLGFARKVIVLTLVDSWLFAYASALLLFGVGSSLDWAACEVGIWWCIVSLNVSFVKTPYVFIKSKYAWTSQILYASSKVMIYLFLMERLAVVHVNTITGTLTVKERFTSWWYRIAFGLLALWVAVAIDLCFARNAVLNENGTCQIGLKIWGTVPILVVDFTVNIFLTTGFLKPVYNAGFKKAGKLVKDSCLAACLALATSFANILILSLMRGM